MVPIPHKSKKGFIKWMEDNGYSINYTTKCLRTIDRLLENTIVITPEVIREFLYKKNTRNGNSQNTLMNRSAIKNYLIYLEEQHKIELPRFRYPRMKKQSKKIHQIVSPEEVKQFIKKVPSEFRLYVKILFFAALRLTECAKIRVEDFNWKEWSRSKNEVGELKIINAKGNKDRIVYIPSELMHEILHKVEKNEYGELEKGLLFDFDFEAYVNHKIVKKKKKREYAEFLYYVSVGDKVRRIIREVSKGKIHSHMLRHVRATQISEILQPVELRDVLGHESIATTNVYLHSSGEKIKDKLNKVV